MLLIIASAGAGNAKNGFSPFHTGAFSIYMPKELEVMPNHGRNGITSVIGASERPGLGRVVYAVMSAPIPKEVLAQKKNGQLSYQDFCVKVGQETTRSILRDMTSDTPQFSPAVESPLGGYSSFRIGFRTKKLHGIIQTASYRGQAVIILMMAQKTGLLNEFSSWRNTFKYR